MEEERERGAEKIGALPLTFWRELSKASADSRMIASCDPIKGSNQKPKIRKCLQEMKNYLPSGGALLEEKFRTARMRGEENREPVRRDNGGGIETSNLG